MRPAKPKLGRMLTCEEIRSIGSFYGSYTHLWHLIELVLEREITAEILNDAIERAEAC